MCMPMCWKLACERGRAISITALSSRKYGAGKSNDKPGSRGMKKTIALLGAAMFALGLASPGFAQEWPQRPIRIIVSFGPGGGADIIGRILGDAMQTRLGKPVVIENKPGAGGI